MEEVEIDAKKVQEDKLKIIKKKQSERAMKINKDKYMEDIKI